MPQSRLVITTSQKNGIVTIDYDATLRVFLSQHEQISFSAERLLQMLNGWSKVQRVTTTMMGGMRVEVEGACCLLTHAATSALRELYVHRHDWHIDYPYVLDLLLREQSMVEA